MLLLLLLLLFMKGSRNVTKASVISAWIQKQTGKYDLLFVSVYSVHCTRIFKLIPRKDSKCICTLQFSCYFRFASCCLSFPLSLCVCEFTIFIIQRPISDACLFDGIQINVCNWYAEDILDMTTNCPNNGVISSLSRTPDELFIWWNRICRIFSGKMKDVSGIPFICAHILKGFGQ